MPAFLAILIVLVAAVPGAAQHPSLRAGEWLRVDFTARVQSDIRRSEAPIRGDEDGDGTPTRLPRWGPRWLDIARRRIGIEGRVARIFDYQAEYEIGARQWRDVYIDYRQFKPVQLRAGVFKLPFGLDENTSATSLDFIYRARISSRLAPGRDRGVSAHGRLLKNVVSYDAGVFGNDGDNARPSHSARVFGKRTFAARVLVYPFRNAGSALADLHIGGAITTSDVPLGFPAIRARTVFGTSFFDSDVWVRGRRQRSGVEARWQPGRMTIQSEYIRLTDQRRGQSVEDTDLSPLVAQGWYVSATYALTRKRSRFRRIEMAARYESLSFGSTGRQNEPSTSVRADVVLGNVDRVMTIGANWQLNRWIKVQGNLMREAIGRPSMGPLPERAAFWSRALRLQLTL